MDASCVTWDLLPLKKWCIINEIPNDIVHYIVCGFYESLVKRDIGEMAAITKMLDCLNTPCKSHILFLPYRIRAPEILLHRTRTILDGAVDNRLWEYIEVIDLMTDDGTIEADDILHVLQQGIREHNTTAFKVLYECDKLDSVQCLESFVLSECQKFSALGIWQVHHVNRMSPLIKYFLDKQAEEPLLEWLTVWQRKGLNVCKNVQGLTEKQQVQMTFLCNKQQSPEMRQRRLNSLKYNVYSDQVLH